MDELCRFCAKHSTTLENIFAKREQPANEPLLIVLLDYCTGCVIREWDLLPNKICRSCISAAKSAFEFQIRCQQSQKYFKELLAKDEPKPDIDEFIIDDRCAFESTLNEDLIKQEADDTIDEIEDNSKYSDESSTTTKINTSINEDHSEESATKILKESTQPHSDERLHKFEVSEPSLMNGILEELKSLRKEVKDFRDQNGKMINKLKEEIITVKEEARKQRHDTTFSDLFAFAQKLPCSTKEEFNEFDNAIQKNNDELNKFKKFIGKIGEDSSAQFLRAAIRKVFSDELAVGYSWRGTSTKPSAEKSFVVTTIKNVCYHKFSATDKEMNVVLQKHFVHASDRVSKKRKRKD